MLHNKFNSSGLRTRTLKKIQKQDWKKFKPSKSKLYKTARNLLPKYLRRICPSHEEIRSKYGDLYIANSDKLIFFIQAISELMNKLDPRIGLGTFDESNLDDNKTRLLFNETLEG